MNKSLLYINFNIVEIAKVLIHIYHTGLYKYTFLYSSDAAVL